jgi:hypothetical protein
MDKNQWLNKINGDYLLSKPNNSVPVMELYSAHKPTTERELAALIDSHYKTKCHCGIVSKGTVEMFANKLYDAQSYNQMAKQLFMSQNNNQLCTYYECYEWVYDLFVRCTIQKAVPSQSLALQSLKTKLPLFTIEESASYDDLHFAVDIVVKNSDNEIVAGIQVKSDLYESETSESSQKQNLSKNQQFQKPVYYLIYKKNKDGKIVLKNIDEVVKQIKSKGNLKA